MQPLCPIMLRSLWHWDLNFTMIYIQNTVAGECDRRHCRNHSIETASCDASAI